MFQIDELTKLVLDAQLGLILEKQAVSKIAYEVYLHLKPKINQKTEDQISDFLVFFYPTIPKMIQKFVYRDIPFRHYLMRTLKLRFLDFQILCHLNYKKERTLIDFDDEKLNSFPWIEKNLSIYENRTSGLRNYLTWVTSKGRNRKKSQAYRVLELALKCSYELNPLQISEISQVLRVKLEDFESLVHQVWTLQDKKIRVRENYLDQIGFFYGEYLQARYEAAQVDQDSIQQVWALRAQSIEKKLIILRKKMKKVTVQPTHFDIGKMLGLARGTVDSGLYYLKENVENGYNALQDDSDTGDE